MEVTQAIKQRRTIRRFRNVPVSEEQLYRLIDLSRLYASGGNLQPIRYSIVNTQSLLDKIFDSLRWAAYLPEFSISDLQRPMAYVILVCEKKSIKSHQFDVGAAATTLMLAAEEEGLGTCCLGSFHEEKLGKLLNIPDHMAPALVVALGYPDQKSEEVLFSGDVRYYEDAEGVFCVPKYSLNDVLLKG